MKEELIAPCGMNCNVCGGYLALTHNVKIRESACPTAKAAGQEIKNTLFSKGDANYF